MDGEKGMPLFGFDLKACTGFNDFTVFGPDYARLGVTFEGNLHDTIFALVEKGRIPETGWDLQSRWHFNSQIGLAGFGASGIGCSHGVGVLVFSKHALDG